MDRMKASLRYRTYLVYLVLILIIMFCIPYIKDVYDLAYR